jgi:predicted  nucleic acid-binding Zn-ribbon protein
MQNLLLPYLIGVVSTVVVPAVGLVAYVASYLRGREYERMRERLPLATRYEDLTARVSDLEELRDSIQQQLTEANEVINEAERARDFLDLHREEIAQMRIEKEDLARHRLEFDAVITKLADAQQKLEEAERALNEKRFEFEQISSRLSTAKERAEALALQLETDQERLRTLEKDLTESRETLDKSRQELQEIEERVAAARAELATLNPRLEAMRLQRDELSEQVNTLEQKASEFRASRNSLEEQISGLQTRLEDSQSQLDEMRKEARRRDKTLATAEEALRELWQPAIAAGEFTNELSTNGDPENSEIQMIQKVADYLDAHQLHFPQRTLRAFHTSLKIADQTPLLVLAGISGTGKSLLPRRYAEATGMHFLNVPVQPRWDGPQDVLGFFNYLENRYKATELLRALIQMDEHCVDWVADDYYEHFVDDRLLLVLLDEMNLARVEYYFSEFLSRLETRRDISIDDPTDRAKASILLDLGDIGTETPPRVFVDRNVLFVGTMNEDESTMTLSDKVIDRAGVMRFGKPKRLSNNRATGTPQPETLRAKDYLGWSTWLSWIENGSKRKPPTEFEERIEQLNAALSLIGRPFGYRARDAMMAYIGQYP